MEIDASHSLVAVECVHRKVIVRLKQKGLTAFPVEDIFEKIGLEAESRHVPKDVCDMDLSGNLIVAIPQDIGKFSNIQQLDLSSNSISFLPDELLKLTSLKVFMCRNNRLTCDSIPKEFGSSLSNLESINFSGNAFINFPDQLLGMQSLKVLHLGGNRIRELPEKIDKLQNLENLYLGGNHISQVPPQVGNLSKLMCLVLCDNHITELPFELARLKKLQSLSLHNNHLTTLPPDIVKLTNLCELSLRSNPLVVRFVRDLAWEPPSLLELTARTIKNKNVWFGGGLLPKPLMKYLETACHCLNPDCSGVYFDSHIESVKFVDFCGKFRLPLMQYLCSPQCFPRYSSCSSTSSSSDAESDDEAAVPQNRIKKVLLG